jgi:VanZ family protein
MRLPDQIYKDHPLLSAGFFIMLAMTLLILLMPAEDLLRLKLWVVRSWPWVLDWSQSSEVQYSDKWVHGGLFTVLGVLGALAWRQAWVRVLLLLGLVFLGALTEFLQAYVPGRSMSAADWLADVTGAVFGVGLGVFFVRWKRWRRLQKRG